MSDWIHSLPVMWMTALVFAAVFLMAALIYLLVMTLASGDRARAFKAVNPGLMSPLGVIFGLFVAFTAVQVWNDNDRANAALDREASALRAVVVFSSSFPGQPQERLRTLIRNYVDEVVAREWPLMAHRELTLRTAPQHLFEALQLTLALSPNNPGQQEAQHEIVASLESALDARRQRIIISRAEVNPLKWLCLMIQAVTALFVIAFVHSDNRLAAIITIAIFATGVATSVVLIAAYDRPFIGQLSITPEPLLQVKP